METLNAAQYISVSLVLRIKTVVDCRFDTSITNALLPETHNFMYVFKY